MKIALVGYGAMGRLVGKLAVAQGHEIATTIDIDDAANPVDELAGALSGSDVAIDFSIASAVPKNAEASAIAGVPLVVTATEGVPTLRLIVPAAPAVALNPGIEGSFGFDLALCNTQQC